MSFTLFYMWEPYREHIITCHNFYLEQAKDRLLSKFENIESEANEHAQQWLNNQDLDDDNYDDLSELFGETCLGFYELLYEMQNRTRLSVVAGMFHEWDKLLRDWMAKESLRSFGYSEELKKAIWKVNFVEIIEFFECFGWDIKSKSYFASLNRCRLVVNSYKHGEGGTLNEIAKEHPDFIDNRGKNMTNFIVQYTDLKVNDDHMAEFSDAIISFWKDVPEYIYAEEEFYVPHWFHKASKKTN